MNISNKKKKFFKRLSKSEVGDTVKVVNFKRKHFKEELSVSDGFGIVDLKEDPKEFCQWLFSEKFDLRFKPTSRNSEDFGVDVTIIKLIGQ